MLMTRWLFRIFPRVAGGSASAMCHKALVMRLADVHLPEPLSLHCIMRRNINVRLLLLLLLNGCET